MRSGRPRRVAPWMRVLIGVILGLVIGGVIAVALTMSSPADQATSYGTMTETEAAHTTQQRPATCMVFEALKTDFKIGEPVAFRLINNCGEDVTLPNTAPWIVKDSKGRTVFAPIALQVITDVRPGSHREWTWDQRNNIGFRVKPGTYYIELKTLSHGAFRISIRIQP